MQVDLSSWNSLQMQPCQSLGTYLYELTKILYGNVHSITLHVQSYDEIIAIVSYAL
jgi:hypothetical protein